MKKTALTDQHIALGAKMSSFAGYNMPISYSGINDEHKTVRNGVGVFDVSHMGEFLIKGHEAINLIQYISSNNISNLKIGKVQYSCLTNKKGGIVDDILVYRLEQNKYMLVVNASNIKKDWNWINKNNKFNAIVENISENISVFAIQGPQSKSLLQKMTKCDLNDIPYYSFQFDKLGDVSNIIISATGYTGSGGYELYVENKYAVIIWNKIIENGKSFDLKPIGLAARDTLRLEMGYCLYGNDIDDNTSPIEAGLSWICKFQKKFIGSERLLRQFNSGIEKKLIGFALLEKGIPRKGYTILDENENRIGIVTSGALSPSLSKGIGLGYVKFKNSNVGEKIIIQIRSKNTSAVIIKLPFYK